MDIMNLNNNGTEFRIIRTDRKSFCIKSGSDGFVVRVPKRATEAEVNDFLNQHKLWIEKQKLRTEKLKKEYEQLKPLSETELLRIKKKAKNVIPERVDYYARLMGVCYGKITIRTQKGRWGSCSASGNLSFNCLLMLAPGAVIDSVVVHELCHIKVKNHSQKFYNEVIKVFPDYWNCHKWLKENGDLIILRANGQAM